MMKNAHLENGSRPQSPQRRARMGERIKMASTHAGLSLKDLANRLGVKPDTVYQYVRGITTTPVRTLEQIASITGLPASYFDPDVPVTEVGTPDPAPAPGGGARSGPAIALPDRIQLEMGHLQSLAQAQNFPKRDRAAYMSSLEQLLALARAIQNKDQEAWSLWMLGCAQMEDNNLEKARELTDHAVQLFEEAGLSNYRDLASLDLSLILVHAGELEIAKEVLGPARQNEMANVRWRAECTLGSIWFREQNHGEAIRCYGRAAQISSELDPEVRQRDCIPQLMSHVADVVRATGHDDQALMLWAQCLQQAAGSRNAGLFLEALMEAAQCSFNVGNLGEAKQRLEMAVVLASFLFEDEARLSIARSLLAQVQVAIGAVPEAAESARQAVRVASRTRNTRSVIIATMMEAEASLAGGDWRGAIVRSTDALETAASSGRTREVSNIRELRARAWLCAHEAAVASGDRAAAVEARASALSEAQQALAVADSTDTVREAVAAHVTLARIYGASGDSAMAEEHARAAIETSNAGAVGLQRLLGQDVDETTRLLRLAGMEAPELFRGRKVSLPMLEWQAHYIAGESRAAQLGPGEAFEDMRAAAEAIDLITSSLTRREAHKFQAAHQDARQVFQKLAAFAITDGEQKEAARLLRRAHWASDDGGPKAISGSS
ncbi:MAG: helix-turn-helix transcriptional regulator [Armatimonadetes bacterium]|nr:helix-turn-helix transcriptional regulator [Armatimonadota bacterium]MDE2205039.1 helix-turn-helix transcriptional regulator [Armatimonadota bacterium]